MSVALACICAGAEEHAAFAQADAVFRGIARSHSDGNGDLITTFDVTAGWKGDLPRRVSVDCGGGSCVQYFPLGDEYVMHVSSGERPWSRWVATCGLVSRSVAQLASYVTEPSRSA